MALLYDHVVHAKSKGDKALLEHCLGPVKALVSRPGACWVALPWTCFSARHNEPSTVVVAQYRPFGREPETADDLRTARKIHCISTEGRDYGNGHFFAINDFVILADCARHRVQRSLCTIRDRSGGGPLTGPGRLLGHMRAVSSNCESSSL